jgi:hypothetical protein
VVKPTAINGGDWDRETNPAESLNVYRKAGAFLKGREERMGADSDDPIRENPSYPFHPWLNQPPSAKEIGTAEKRGSGPGFIISWQHFS